MFKFLLLFIVLLTTCRAQSHYIRQVKTTLQGLKFALEKIKAAAELSINVSQQIFIAKAEEREKELDRISMEAAQKTKAVEDEIEKLDKS